MDDERRLTVARSLIAKAEPEAWVVPVQVLGELFNVLVRKGGLGRTEGRARVRLWRDVAVVVDTSDPIMEAAMALAETHRLSIWDAVVLAAAADAGRGMLLSEDMRHGFVWGGVTVIDPFREPSDPLLRPLLGLFPSA